MEEKILEQLIELNKHLDTLSYRKVTGKNPYELLTKEQIREEYGIGESKLQRMFNDPNFQAQRYTSPQKVQRQALDKYLAVSHDNLCG